MTNMIAMHPVQYAEVLKRWTAKEMDHVTLRKMYAYGFSGRMGPYKLRVSTSCLQDRITYYDAQSKIRRITLNELHAMLRRYMRNHP